MVLDQRRAIQNPIAVVHVSDVADLAMVRAMNVSADDAVGLVITRRCKHCAIAEVSEKLDRLARRIAEIVGKRTAFVVTRFAAPVIPVMNPLAARVDLRADHRQQTIRIKRAIELMPMDDKHPRAARSACESAKSSKR